VAKKKTKKKAAPNLGAAFSHKLPAAITKYTKGGRRRVDLSCENGHRQEHELNRDMPVKSYGKCSCGLTLDMMLDGMNVGIITPPSGSYASKHGQMIARDLTKRNEKLATKQWDNHAPGQVLGETPNATPGGPFDPKSKFNKHKRAKDTYIPKSGGGLSKATGKTK